MSDFRSARNRTEAQQRIRDMLAKVRTEVSSLLSGMFCVLTLLTMPYGWQEQRIPTSWLRHPLSDDLPLPAGPGESLPSDLSSLSFPERRARLETLQTNLRHDLQEQWKFQALGAGPHLRASALVRNRDSLQEQRVALQACASYPLALHGTDPVGSPPRRLPSRQTWSDPSKKPLAHLDRAIGTLSIQLERQQAYERLASEIQAAERAIQELNTSLNENWWHDVPFVSQHGLKYGGRATQQGCVPAATAMILQYWHHLDPQNNVLTAQELLDLNAAQQQFTLSGMSPSKIHDDLQNLGYPYVVDRVDATFEELQQAVLEGPVIAMVKLEMRTEGGNHVVVVTGISPDGSQIRVNDPWLDAPQIYTQEEFLRSWGAAFGPRGRSHIFTIIRAS